MDKILTQQFGPTLYLNEIVSWDRIRFHQEKMEINSFLHVKNKQFLFSSTSAEEIWCWTLVEAIANEQSDKEEKAKIPSKLLSMLNTLP